MSDPSSRAFAINRPIGRAAFATGYRAAVIDLDLASSPDPEPTPLCSYDETVVDDVMTLSGQCEITVGEPCTLLLTFGLTFNSACSSQFDYSSDLGSDSQVVEGSDTNSGSFEIVVPDAGTYLISFGGYQIPGPASPDPTSLRMVVTIELA